MKSEPNDLKQGLQDIYTPDSATKMAKAALEAHHDRPDEFIRALVPILDHSTDPKTRDAIAWLISGAFARSTAQEMALNDYLDGIRAGRDVTEEWRRARYGDDESPTTEASRAGGDQAEQEPGTLKSAAQAADEAVDDFAELVLKHRHSPRIRARIVEVIETRTNGSGVDGEGIEATDGETYIFTDEDGLPALIVKMDGGYIIVEAKDPDGEIVNGMVVGYDAKRAPVGDIHRRNRWQVIGELMELIDHEPVFVHVEKLVWAAQRTNGEEEFKHQVLADAVALLLESPHTPDGLRRSIADDLLSISSDTRASGPLDPDNVREWFPIALARLAGKEQSRHDEAKP
jgi:hypothetical protein